MKLFKVNSFNKDDYVFFSIVFLLSILLIMIQVSIWTGDYSHSNLNDLKEEVKEKERLTLELEKSNFLLEQEKNQLRSERNAIEGLARSELGLIKPGEVFYKFQSPPIKNKEIEFNLTKEDQ